MTWPTLLFFNLRLAVGIRLGEDKERWSVGKDYNTAGDM